MVKFVLSGFSDEIDKDLNIQISELKRNNINHMEIRGVYGKGIVEYTINEVKEIKKLLDSEGISVSSVGSPIGKISITDRFKAHLDLFKHTLEIAGILSSNYIRLFSFYIPEGGNPADFRDEVLERFNSFTEAAKGTGIILAHENEKGIYGDTAERCVDIIESMNCSYVKAVLILRILYSAALKHIPSIFNAETAYRIHAYKGRFIRFWKSSSGRYGEWKDKRDSVGYKRVV